VWVRGVGRGGRTLSWAYKFGRLHMGCAWVLEGEAWDTSLPTVWHALGNFAGWVEVGWVGWMAVDVQQLWDWVAWAE
jgi:hypothetical protein